MTKPVYHVLYIDDEVDTQRFESLRDNLSDEGVSLDATGDLNQALDILRRKASSYSAVVLDILMPPSMYEIEETNGGTTTGVRFVEDLRQVAPTIPVVVVSVKDREELQPKMERFGVSVFLRKPVKAEEILAGIQRVVPHSQLRTK